MGVCLRYKNSFAGERPMSLTKLDIAKAIAHENGYGLRESPKILEVFLELIKGRLVAGEEILINGVGRFYLLEKRERRGRNPSTGTDLILDARKIVRFHCSSKLKARLNQ